MSSKDLDVAIEWAAAEGWNPGLNDGDSFYAADSSGFLAGELDGEIVCTISAVSYGADFGFIG
ncbi:GNAT family N-acetyltransferase, partial [Acinetobacter baumannii]